MYTYAYTYTNRTYKLFIIIIKYVQLEVAIASEATSSAGVQCIKRSLHSSNNGCFSGKINSSCIDLHKDLNSFSVAQKKH